MNALKMPDSSRRAAGRQTKTEADASVLALIAPLTRGHEGTIARPRLRAPEPFAVSDDLRDIIGASADPMASLCLHLPLPERVALEASSAERFDVALTDERGLGDAFHGSLRAQLARRRELINQQRRQERYTRPLYLAALRAQARARHAYGPTLSLVVRENGRDVTYTGRLSDLHRAQPDAATRALLEEAGVSLEGVGKPDRMEWA